MNVSIRETGFVITPESPQDVVFLKSLGFVRDGDSALCERRGLKQAKPGDPEFAIFVAAFAVVTAPQAEGTS